MLKSLRTEIPEPPLRLLVAGEMPNPIQPREFEIRFLVFGHLSHPRPDQDSPPRNRP